MPITKVNSCAIGKLTILFKICKAVVTSGALKNTQEIIINILMYTTLTGLGALFKNSVKE